MPVDVEARWEWLLDQRSPDIFAVADDRARRSVALRRLSGDVIEIVAALLEATRDRFLEQGRTRAADYRLFLECFNEVVREVEVGTRALRASGQRSSGVVGRHLARHRYTTRRLASVASPVVDEMDSLVFGDALVLRLCTPSILLGQARVADPLESDVSVSYSGELGSPLEFIGGSGHFAATADLVTRCYRGDPDRDQAFLLTNGSTGANWTIGLYLQRTLEPGERVLVSRGAHISLPQALTDLRVPWDYLPAQTQPGLDGVPVATPSEVAAAVAADARVRAVCLNGPSYEGVFLDVAGIRKALDDTERDGNDTKRGGVLLIVDEAWGAHLPFSPVLADRAAFAQGADIVNASTHKQGGALQGTAVIVARGPEDGGDEKREDNEECGPVWPVDLAALEGAFLSVASTSPSYQLLASMDTAYRVLEADGGRMIEDCMGLAAELACELSTRGGFILFSRDSSGEWDGTSDPLKVTVTVPDEIVAFALQRELEKAKIVVEKATFGTLTFLIPFQMLTWQLDDDVIARVASAASVLVTSTVDPLPRGRPQLGDPLGAGRAQRRMEAHEAAAFRRAPKVLDYLQAAGSIAAERVAAYPPGVPIVAEGYLIGEEEARFLHEVHKVEGHIVSNGGSEPGTVMVVPPELCGADSQSAGAMTQTVTPVPDDAQPVPVVPRGAASAPARGSSSEPAGSGRRVGKATTSRIVRAPVRSITSRSTPIPSPPVGGRPASRART